jgi:hypothetical protein
VCQQASPPESHISVNSRTYLPIKTTSCTRSNIQNRDIPICLSPTHDGVWGISDTDIDDQTGWVVVRTRFEYNCSFYCEYLAANFGPYALRPEGRFSHHHASNTGYVRLEHKSPRFRVENFRNSLPHVASFRSISNVSAILISLRRR